MSAVIQFAIASGNLWICAVLECSNLHEGILFSSQLADPMVFTLSCATAHEATGTLDRKQSLLQVQSKIGQRGEEVNLLDHLMITKRSKQSTSLIKRVLRAAARENRTKVSTSTADSANVGAGTDSTVDADHTNANLMDLLHGNRTFQKSQLESGSPGVLLQKLALAAAAKSSHDLSDTREKTKLSEALTSASLKSTASGGVSRMDPAAFAVIGLLVLGLAILIFYARSQGLLTNEKPEGAGEDMLRQANFVASNDSRASLQGTGPQASFVAANDSRASLKGTATQSMPMRMHVGPAQTSPQLSIFRASPQPSIKTPEAMQQRRGDQVPSPYLCPGLVVPVGFECTLVVPAIPSSAALLDPVSLQVKDLQGNPVIQGDVLATKVAKIGQRPLVVLRSCTGPRLTGEQMLPVACSCKINYEAGGQRNICIYDSRNELFAQVRKDAINRRYFLTNSGSRLYFEGSFVNHHVKVIEDQMQVVAETTPDGSSSFQLAVRPGTDIGLVLAVLYSVEIMESD
jgi:hypothetical protein